MNENIDKQINRYLKFMRWLINGYNRHGIPLDMWNNSNLTPEWVEQNYNVNFND